MIRTLSQRKAEALARKQAAVRELLTVLHDRAPALGGRFLLYGSAARGELRPDSDVDLLLDFPDRQATTAAWDMVEAECGRLGLACDIRPIDSCGRRFLEHVLAEARSLP